MISSFRPLGFTPAFGRAGRPLCGQARRWAEAQLYLKSNNMGYGYGDSALWVTLQCFTPTSKSARWGAAFGGAVAL